MADTVKGRPRVVGGPETLSSGGKKWTITLDNGSTVVTFTQGCADAVNGALDEELTFEVDLPENPNMAPKVLKVMKDGATLWEKSSGGGGRRDWVDTTPSQDARHAVGSATALIGQLAAARLAKGEDVKNTDVLVDVLQASEALHEQIRELTRRGQS